MTAKGGLQIHRLGMSQDMYTGFQGLGFRILGFRLYSEQRGLGFRVRVSYIQTSFHNHKLC